MSAGMRTQFPIEETVSDSQQLPPRREQVARRKPRLRQKHQSSTFRRWQSWVVRRFTKPGLLALTGLLLTVGLAADTEHSAAYELLAILVCLLVVAMLWAPAFRGRFRVERFLPR